MAPRRVVRPKERVLARILVVADADQRLSSRRTTVARICRRVRSRRADRAPRARGCREGISLNSRHAAELDLSRRPVEGVIAVLLPPPSIARRGLDVAMRIRTIHTSSRPAGSPAPGCGGARLRPRSGAPSGAVEHPPFPARCRPDAGHAIGHVEKAGARGPSRDAPGSADSIRIGPDSTGEREGRKILPAAG